MQKLLNIQLSNFPDRKDEGLPRDFPLAERFMMERILTSGRFSSAREFSEALGVSQPVVSNALKMLNLPPDEIERILFEVR